MKVERKFFVWILRKISDPALTITSPFRIENPVNRPSERDYTVEKEQENGKESTTTVGHRNKHARGHARNAHSFQDSKTT